MIKLKSLVEYDRVASFTLACMLLLVISSPFVARQTPLLAILLLIGRSLHRTLVALLPLVHQLDPLPTLAPPSLLAHHVGLSGARRVLPSQRLAYRL